MSRARSRSVTAALAFFVMLSITQVAIPTVQAQTFTLLYSFQGTPDGEFPGGELVFDKLGNLYGTTTQGGMSGIGGVLFKLDPSGNETILHSFGVSSGDGDGPMGRIARVAGNIYGTTQGGGKLGGMTCAFNECGTVFEFSGGKEKVLFTFNGSGQNSGPVGGLIADASGNRYGVSPQSSSGCQAQGKNCGIVFKVSQGQVSVLYTFGVPPDGSGPRGPLVMDRSGNLHGTTMQGGALGWGTVFELSPNSDGTWSEKVLYSFRGFQSGGDGAFPNALAVGLNGSLYGTTLAGGHFINTSRCTLGCGVVFKLKQNPDGTWAERVVHKFGVVATDGQNPGGALLLDIHGNLYGVTGGGGAFANGTVYKLDGAGQETILHAFAGGQTDGSLPGAGLIMDASGNLYGTTAAGGASAGGGFGTVFKITP